MGKGARVFEVSMNEIARRRPFALTRVAGVGVAATLLVAGIALGSPLMGFLDIPSALLVFGFTGASLVACHGIVGSARSVQTLLVGGTESDLALSTAFFMQAGGIFIGSGVMGTLIGLVQMLQNLDDPTRIGPAMAVALLTSLYGIFGAVCGFSAAITVARSAPDPEAVVSTSGVSSVVLATGAMILLMPGLSAFAVLGWVF